VVWAIALAEKSNAAIASAMPAWRLKFNMVVSLGVICLVVLVTLRLPHYQSWSDHRARG
jgi:hypothetical protein